MTTVTYEYYISQVHTCRAAKMRYSGAYIQYVAVIVYRV